MLTSKDLVEAPGVDDTFEQGSRTAQSISGIFVEGNLFLFVRQ